MLHQDRIEQLIRELPDGDAMKPVAKVNAMYDELLALNPSPNDMKRALHGTRMTAHMLVGILYRLDAIERYLYRRHIDNRD